MPERETPVAVGILLLPDFAMLDYALAAAAFEAANGAAGRTLYTVTLVGPDLAPVEAASGAALVPDAALGDAPTFDRVLVCAGASPPGATRRRAVAWLEGLARAGTSVDGFGGAAALLAEAGRADGVERPVSGLGVLDAATDLIARDVGRALAAEVAVRLGRAPEARAGDPRPAADPRLARVLAHMEAGLADPLDRRALARLAGLSLRRLEMLFAEGLGTTAGKHLLALRLDRARDLIGRTGLPVAEAAAACGFRSASHFSRSYKARFGTPPLADRRR